MKVSSLNFTKLIAFTIAISFVGISARANCRDFYQRRIDTTFQDLEIDGATSVVSSAGAAPGWFYAGEAGPASLIIGGGVVAYASGAVSSGWMLYREHQKANAKSVINLLDEAELGNGIHLSKVSEIVSAQIGKQVSPAVVAAIVLTANQKEVFCHSSSELYNPKQITSFIADVLKK